MKFQGKSTADRRKSEASWKRWLISVGENSPKARFTLRLVSEIEEHIGKPQPRVGGVSIRAMMTASQAELNGRWLDDADFRDVILTLSRYWHYGPSFRNFAISRGYIKAEDR